MSLNACIIAYTIYETDFRVARYAKILSALGYNVDVIALQNDGQPKFNVIDKVNVYRVAKRDFNEKRKTDFVVGILKFFVLGAVRLLKNSLRKHYSIIHAHNVPDLLVFMALPQKLGGTKIILDIHDILPEFFCQKFGYNINSKFAHFLSKIERYSVRFSDHVIVANDLWRNKLIERNQIGKQNCTTIMNYPRSAMLNSNTPRGLNEHFNLIYPGTLSYIHGLDVAIKAVAIARNEIPNIRLNIYGAHPNHRIKNELDALIASLNIGDIVKINSNIPANVLREKFKSTDIGIVPKRSGIFASEAFSTKTLEYMAANVPVLSSKTKIDQFYFNDSMIKFFEPGNHIDMAKGIIELYHDPGKRFALAKNAKNFITQNLWENKQDLYLEVIQKLSNNHHCSALAN